MEPGLIDDHLLGRITKSNGGWRFSTRRKACASSLFVTITSGTPSARRLSASVTTGNGPRRTCSRTPPARRPRGNQAEPAKARSMRTAGDLLERIPSPCIRRSGTPSTPAGIRRRSPPAAGPVELTDRDVDTELDQRSFMSNVTNFGLTSNPTSPGGSGREAVRPWSIVDHTCMVVDCQQLLAQADDPRRRGLPVPGWRSPAPRAHVRRKNEVHVLMVDSAPEGPRSGRRPVWRGAPRWPSSAVA